MANVEMSHWTGKVIANGRFAVGDLLGEGGMGQVFRARDHKNDRDVVIKVPHVVLLRDPEFAERFQREVESVRTLVHPHIVPVLCGGIHRDVPFVVQRYMPGGSLAEKIESTSLSDRIAHLRTWLPQVADALDFVHDQGFIHRDIKPENIFLDKRGRAYLGDFGIIKATSELSGSGSGSGLTMTGAVIGTPEYMAPEMAMGEEYDHRSDQYSLAVTVYEYLNGTPPFQGATPAAVLVQLTTTEVPNLSSLHPSIPAGISTAVSQGLCRDPDYRFDSCVELCEAVVANEDSPSESDEWEEPTEERVATASFRTTASHRTRPRQSRRTSKTRLPQLDPETPFAPLLNPALVLVHKTRQRYGLRWPIAALVSLLILTGVTFRVSPWMSHREQAASRGERGVETTPDLHSTAPPVERNQQLLPRKTDSEQDSVVSNTDPIAATTSRDLSTSPETLASKGQDDKPALSDTLAREPEFHPVSQLVADSGTMLIKSGGMRFVAVRGIVPLRLQVESFNAVLNLATDQNALQLTEYLDFELERQSAVAGPDPWAGPWNRVSIRKAVDLLDRTEFDLDVVGEEYRDAVLTMPLLYRVTGSWEQAVGQHGVIASHRRIKKILSKQEQLQAEVRARAAITAAGALQLATGGFTVVQYDTRRMHARLAGDPQMMGRYVQARRDVVEDVGLTVNSDSAAEISPSVVGGAEFRLFRFFDFDVQPGTAYRYRVRLKLRNPNLDRDPTELADGSSRIGEFRFTPWSQPTDAAVVKKETNLFVRQVDERRGVSMDAYQWLTETGTYVNGMFEGLNRAERVAAWTSEKKSRRGETTMEGGVVTDVLRPARETFMYERIDYVTPHSLIDFERTSVINPDEFPDLELSSKRVPTILEEVVTINRFGELQHIDSDNQSQGYRGWQNLMAQQKQLWGHLRRVAQPTGGIAGLLGSGAEDKHRRRSSILKRRKADASK